MFRYSVTVLLLMFGLGVESQMSCGGCDCTISDPDNGEHAIIDVQPPCAQGLITWMNAYGAVRIHLRAPSSGNFRFCMRVESNDADTVISREVLSKTPGNYRLKVLGETKVKLSPLFNVRGRSKEYCISGSGDVKLYLETERKRDDTGLPRVKVHYDVERTATAQIYNPLEDCRPCTDDELLRAYCSSDFVAEGTMEEVAHDQDEDKTNIRVSVTRLISQATRIFTQTDEWSRPHELKGVVRAPRRCGIRHGTGEFLFTGRVRLGDPVLSCAPRLDQWKQLLQDALVNGKLECSYG